MKCSFVSLKPFLLLYDCQTSDAARRCRVRNGYRWVCESVCLYVGGWLGLAVYSEPELDVSDPLPDVDCCNIKVPCVNVTKWAQRERGVSEWDNERMCERLSGCERSGGLMQYSPSPRPNHDDDAAVSHPPSYREPLGVQKANIVTDIFQDFILFFMNQSTAIHVHHD